MNRRGLLAALALTASAAAGAVAWPRRRPAPPGHRRAGPELRMPLQAGQVVFCQQGNLAPEGQTHSLPNNLYALDLATLIEPTVVIVAAAPGRVVYAQRGVDPDDRNAGLQYGNHVKIDHGDDTFTLYAHLDRVDVEVGREVSAATPLGTMGSTGSAGGRHLHFSLQQGDEPGGGANGSIPIETLLVADLAQGTSFRRLAGGDLRAGAETPWQGQLYGSENSPGPPLLGPAPEPLAAQLAAGQSQLAAALARRQRLDEVHRRWRERDVDWAEAELGRLLAEDPQQPVAHYLLAVSVCYRRKQPDRARSALEQALATNRLAHRHETWLDGWAHAELGALLFEAGEADRAQDHFNQALRRATRREVIEQVTRFQREHPRPPSSAAPRSGAAGAR